MWSDSSIENILANRQYTGYAVDAITTAVNYKVYKTVYNPVEEQQVIPNMQEPIISEALFDRVQELRSHKRRNTKQVCLRACCFAPTAKIHYIRNVVLAQVIENLADFVRCYKSVFLHLIVKNSDAARQSDVQKPKQSTAASERRIKAIGKAIEGLFEANISGKITDGRFVKMTANYEKEQRELIEQVADSHKRPQEAKQNKVDLRMLLRGLREYADIRQLTHELVNTLIHRIEVHSKDE